MSKINKVLYNVDQRADTTAAEKKIARDNIGAVDIEAVYEVRDYARDLADELENAKQNVLTPGHNITIEDNVIDARQQFHVIPYVNDPGTLTEAAYEELSTAVASREPVVILSVTGSNSSQWLFRKVSTAGYEFYTYDGDRELSNMRVAGDRSVTMTSVRIPEPAVHTTQHLNVGSPSDTPYTLFTYDGLDFTFKANPNVCSLRVSSSEVASISGLVEHVSDSSQVTDGKTLFNNQAISTAYALYNMSQYEIVSTVTEVLKINLWYTRNNEPKSITMNVLKTGQVDLSISLIGG